MGTTLTGTVISATYDSLLKVTDNDAITSTAKRITDGLGNDTPLYISSTRVGIGVSPTTTFHVSGNSQIGGNLTVTGDLLVEGSTTTIDTETLSVEDPLIIVGSNNTTSDAVDLGIYGVYDTSGSQNLYAGIFRRAADNKFHIFRDLQSEPTTTVNLSGTGYARASLVLGTLEFESLKDLGESITVTKFVDQADGISNNDNDTTIPTSAAVKDYVDNNSSNTLSQVLVEGNTTGGTNIDVSAGDDINLTDTSEIHLGDSADLVIKHNGTLSSIANNTGTLQIVQNTNDGDIKFFCDDGAGGTENYFQIDGGEQRIKVFNQMRFNDDVELRLGTGNDLRLFHNATNSFIDNYKGDLQIRAHEADKDIVLKTDDGSDGTSNYIVCDGSTGAVRLSHYGTEKFETTSDGINVTGTIKQTGKTLTIEANDPEIILKDTDEGTDDKVFRIINVSEELRFTARNDDNTANADGGDILKITRSGNVGIGETSPDRKLHVNSDSTNIVATFESTDATAAISLQDNSTTNDSKVQVRAIGDDFNIVAGGSQRLTILNTGEVGIGTTSPAAPLQVVATGVGSNGTIGIQGANAHVGFKNSSGTFRSWVGHFNATGHGSDADLNIKTGYGTTGNIRFTADGDTTGAQMFLQGDNARLGIGTVSPQAHIHINSGTANTVAMFESTDTATTIKFKDSTGTCQIETRDDFRFATSGGEKVRIENGGNVGIGTTSPRNDANFVTLQVGSTATAASQIVLDDNDTNGPWRIISNQSLIINDDATERMRIDSSGNLSLATATSLDFNVADFAQIKFKESGAITIDSDNNQSSRNFQFKDGDGSSLMFIGDDGNIGIGTTSPGYKLEVNGNAEFLNNINIKNNAYDDYQIAVDSVGFSVYNRTDAIYNMTISHTGNVGIGTTSPSGGAIGGKVVHLVNSGSTASFRVDRSDSSTTGTISLMDTNSTIGLYGTGQKPMAFSTNSTERMRISSDGKVGIGTTTPAGILQVVNSGVAQLILGYNGNSDNYYDADDHFFRTGSGTNVFEIDSSGDAHLNRYLRHNGDSNSYIGWGAGDDFRIFVGGVQMLRYDEGISGTDYAQFMADEFRMYANGDFHADGDLVAYSTSTSSDERLKKDIKPIDNALDIVDKLQGVHFNWKENNEKSIGYIAQDVEKVLPEMVKEKTHFDKGEFKTVNYAAMVSIMGEAIKELRAEVEQLKKQIK